jgi:hypothetical protein
MPLKLDPSTTAGDTNKIDQLDHLIRNVLQHGISNYPEYPALIDRLRNNPSAQDITDISDWIDNNITDAAARQSAHDLMA